MQKLSKILVGIGIVAAVVAVGILVGWWGSTGPIPKVKPVAETPPLPPAPAPNYPPVTDPSLASAPPAPANPAPAPQSAIVPTAASVVLITNWEDRLDDILSSDSDDRSKVKALLAMFPRLPEDGQVEVAQHLSNLVPDADYAPLGKLLENPRLPGDVQDVLMADVLNRPDSEKLPALLNVAEDPSHAKAGEARDLLELYLGEDYGTNWDQWRQGVSQWLQQNAN